MENKTRYDLNATIESWRAELAAQPNLTPEVRRELETHLRDAITGFQQRGLSDEESFWLARRRVGQPPQLAEEFVKADPAKVWRERVFWMAAAVLVAFILADISGTLMAILHSYFPPIEKIMSENTMILLLWIFQILGIIVLLVRGKANRQFSFLASFIRNRFRLAIVATLSVLAINVLCAAMLFWGYVAYRGVYSPMGPFVFIGNWLSHSVIRELGLVAILVWLMPPQNRKTPKRA